MQSKAVCRAPPARKSLAHAARVESFVHHGAHDSRSPLCSASAVAHDVAASLSSPSTAFAASAASSTAPTPRRRGGSSGRGGVAIANAAVAQSAPEPGAGRVSFTTHSGRRRRVATPRGEAASRPLARASWFCTTAHRQSRRASHLIGWTPPTRSRRRRSGGGGTARCALQ